MKGRKLYTANLEEFTALNFRDKPVVKYYKRVHNFVKSRLGEEYANLWAIPLNIEKPLGPTGKLSWSSNTLKETVQPIAGLSQVRRDDVQRVLDTKTKAINDLVTELSESSNPDDLEWAELLQLIVQIPSQDYIYTDGENAVFVMWGFRLAQDYPKRTIPAKKKPASKTSVRNKRPNQQNIGTRDNSPVSRGEDNENDGFEDDLAHEDDFDGNTQEPLSNNDGGNEQENSGSGKSRKWLWTLLAVLLLLIIVFVAFYFLSESKSALPPEAGVYVPIDSNTIRLDEDSMKFIASDRLNISLIGKNRNLKKFSKEFKKLYSGNEYEIIYFDTITYRLQLRMPTELREPLKQNLPGQMTNYDMLIWEESLYEIEYRPNDPGFNDQSQFWYHENVKAFDAWEVTMGNPDLVVAVIDNGFDISHPELSEKIYRPWNIVQRSPKVTTYGHLDHGTHVAGIAVGLADNSEGLCGVAPACKLMPVQVADPSGRISTTAIVDGIIYAINNGASVINISLGKQYNPNVQFIHPNTQLQYINGAEKEEERFWEHLYQEVERYGATIVFAGGNQNILVGLDPMVRSDKVVKVSATTPGNGKASFSNYGPYSSLSAPGTQILSSVPGGYEYMDGTSMASPVVAGAMALLKSVNPAYTTHQMIDLLQATGFPVGSDQQLGRIIRLDRVLGISSRKRRRLPKASCSDVQHRIDSLLREIERLRQQCHTKGSGDTLKMPVDSSSLTLLQGRWKSTTPLFNTRSGERVDIIFDLNPNSTSSITLLEEYGDVCDGAISLKYSQSQLTLTQSQDALCRASGTSYSPYSFLCVEGINNCAKCKAINKTDASNEFWFELIRIN